jgi:SAM-dependent methyltransferase
MINPDVTAAYDIVASRYDEFYSAKPIFKAENLAIKSMLVGGSFLDGPVLDLGCGTGGLLDLCGNEIKDDDYLGVDPSYKMVSVARSKYPNFHFIVGTANRAPAEFFENTISLFSVSYAPVLVNSLRGIWRSLRPSGRYFIIVYGLARGTRNDYLLSEAGLMAPPAGVGVEELREALNTAGLTSDVLGFVTNESAKAVNDFSGVDDGAVRLIRDSLGGVATEENACYLIAIGGKRNGGTG